MQPADGQNLPAQGPLLGFQLSLNQANFGTCPVLLH